MTPLFFISKLLFYNFSSDLFKFATRYVLSKINFYSATKLGIFTFAAVFVIGNFYLIKNALVANQAYSMGINDNIKIINENIRQLAIGMDACRAMLAQGFASQTVANTAIQTHLFVQTVYLQDILTHFNYHYAANSGFSSAGAMNYIAPHTISPILSNLVHDSAGILMSDAQNTSQSVVSRLNVGLRLNMP